MPPQGKRSGIQTETSMMEVNIVTKFALSSPKCMEQGWIRKVEFTESEETIKCRLILTITTMNKEVDGLFKKVAEQIAQHQGPKYAVWSFCHSLRIQSSIFSDRIVQRMRRKKLRQLQQLAILPRRHDHHLVIVKSTPSPTVAAATPHLQHLASQIKTPPTPSTAPGTVSDANKDKVAPAAVIVSNSPPSPGTASPTCVAPCGYGSRVGLFSKLTKRTLHQWVKREPMLRLTIECGPDFIYYPSGRLAIFTCLPPSDDKVPFHLLYFDEDSSPLLAIASTVSGCTCYWQNGKIRYHFGLNQGMFADEESLSVITWKDNPPEWKKGRIIEYKLNDVITIRYKSNKLFSFVYWNGKDHLVITVDLTDLSSIKSANATYGEEEAVESPNRKGETGSSALKFSEIDTIIVSPPPRKSIDFLYNEYEFFRTNLKECLDELESVFASKDEVPKAPRGADAGKKEKVSTLKSPLFTVTEDKVGPMTLVPGLQGLKVRFPETMAAEPSSPLRSARRSRMMDDGDWSVPEMGKLSMAMNKDDPDDVVTLTEAILLVMSTTRHKKVIGRMKANRSRKSQPPICPKILRLKILQEQLVKQLRQAMNTATRKTLTRNWPFCNCNNQVIPTVTDIEYLSLIENKLLAEQMIIVYITANSDGLTQTEKVLTEIYQKIHRRRQKPCMQFPLDMYRFLKYDIESAANGTKYTVPLLIRRNDVLAGMVMMYLNGRLLFCGFKFNGYGVDRCNFYRQMQACFSDAEDGFCLPSDYKFGRSYTQLCLTPSSVSTSSESSTSSSNTEEDDSGEQESELHEPTTTASHKISQTQHMVSGSF